MIRDERLTKRYGGTVALDGLTLDVPRGGVLGLLGPKGAGKTTFLHLVMGFIHPEAGRIDRRGLLPAQIGYLPERGFFPPRLTVRAYLTTAGRLAGLGGVALRAEILRLLGHLGLEEAIDLRLGVCSHGVLQRVGLAQALLGDPSLLLLDEAMAGLDAAGQKRICGLIVGLRDTGKTVVLSSHNLGEVARVCTHIAVLDRGRLVRSGPVESLLPSRAEVTIVTGPMPARMPSDLRALGAGVLATDGKIRLMGDGVLLKARVLRILLDADVDVREVTEARPMPEEVCLEATEP